MKMFTFSVVCVLAIVFFIAFNLADGEIVQGSDDLQLRQLFAPPPAIQLQSVVGSLSSPLYVTNARDARLFIVQQPGQIKIFQSGALLSTPFLDISSSVNCCGERGLIGLAFHPNYPTTPYFFVHFTSNGTALPDGTTPASGDNVIVRYTANANVADTASGKTLLVIPQPFSNHNGGMIEFGGDGFLYIGKGDGGSGNDPGSRAQNINELLGKILRIDVNQNVNTPPYHAIPTTNPFAGATPGANEIFLVGLRNPFRFSFDRTTGDLWIGDVGQNAREEIDQLPINAAAPGKNLGWRIYEGTLCTNLDPCVTPPNYLAPVAEYAHTGGRCSITGGYVYRGTQIPSLTGSYVYADYCTGEIFRLSGTTPELMLDSPYNISSFGEDSVGELYITALAGQVLKIVAVPSAASAAIIGRITTPNGRGVSGVVLTLNGGELTEPLIARTNPFGYYRFSAVEVGRNYVITATAKNRSFTPASRVFTPLEDISDVNFTAR